MDEKLAASAQLLTQGEANDEFNQAIWLQYKGTCALYIGDFADADFYLQQAIRNLNPNLLHQRAFTALLLAQARLHKKDKEGTLATTRISLPLITATDSPLIFRGLFDHIQNLIDTFSKDSEVKTFIGEVLPDPQLRNLHRYINLPRYLEAAL